MENLNTIGAGIIRWERELDVGLVFFKKYIYHQYYTLLTNTEEANTEFSALLNNLTQQLYQLKAMVKKLGNFF